MKETKVKKKLKNQKGITLIALVITIVVLLILAGVSIATLTGENGILTQAESAREQTIIAEEKEAILIAYTGCQMNSRQSSVTEEELETALKNNGKNDVSVELEGEELIITFLDTNNKYSLTETGGVEYKKPLTAEEAKMIVSAGLITDYANGNNYIYLETAGGEVKMVEATEQTEIEAIDTSNATIITTNGIREIGDGYLIDKKGKVYTWGYNDYGELGNGTTEHSGVPICISDIEDSELKGKNIVSIETEMGAVIARDNQGKLYTWGYNMYGQLGNGMTENSSVPICISDIEGSALKGKNITDIKFDLNTVIAKDNKGKVYTWGENDYGVLGNGTTENSSVPICISDIENSALKGKNIINIEIEASAVIVRDNQGKLYTWGRYNNSVLGTDTREDSNVPICISDIEDSALKGKNITSIDEFSGEVIVRDNQGKVYTWGGNSHGALGNGTTWSTKEPICISDIEGSVLNGKNITSIKDIGMGKIAIDTEGKLYTWGYNSSGQLGTGTAGATENITVPVCISDIEGSALNGKNITSIELAESTVIVKDDDGKLYTWGNNYSGQLGNGTTSISPMCISDIEGSPLKGKDVISVENWNSTIIAKDAEGKIYTWGDNMYGQLGDGTTEDSNLPICISDIEDSVMKDKSIKSIFIVDEYYSLIVYVSTDGMAYKYFWEIID